MCPPIFPQLGESQVRACSTYALVATSWRERLFDKRVVQISDLDAGPIGHRLCEGHDIVDQAIGLPEFVVHLLQGRDHSRAVIEDHEDFIQCNERLRFAFVFGCEEIAIAHKPTKHITLQSLPIVLAVVPA